MLHKDPLIIDAAPYNLIQELQSIPELKDFYLVGGTSLALQLGHCNSIDIDLFTKEEFEASAIEAALSNKFTYALTLARKGTVLAVVNNIKTDFIRHNYPLLKQPVTEEGITFLSKENIAGMKFHDIIQSGKRLKDFIDIYFLLTQFSMQQMIGFFVSKYTYSNPMIAMKAVNYFDDIDETVYPPKMLQPLSIKEITDRIKEATLKPDKLFNQKK